MEPILYLSMGMWCAFILLGVLSALLGGSVSEIWECTKGGLYVVVAFGLFALLMGG